MSVKRYNAALSLLKKSRRIHSTTTYRISLSHTRLCGFIIIVWLVVVRGSIIYIPPIIWTFGAPPQMMKNKIDIGGY